MNFIKNIFKPLKKGAFFNSSEFEMKNMLCGTGDSEITANEIIISKYPFEPSIAFPQQRFNASQIESISIDFGVCKIYVGNDIVFVSAEKKEELKEFAAVNNIKLSKHSWNWDWILEPYLDTELTEKDEQLVLKRLNENVIEKSEVEKLRLEVSEQMYKYNFDTMLWDWCSLGLFDVLAAMRTKYNKNEFRDFYKRAIDVDKRKSVD